MATIIDRITNFSNWVMYTVDEVKYLLDYVGQIARICLNYAKYILSVFPGWLYAILIGILVVSILYVILGRSSSS